MKYFILNNIIVDKDITNQFIDDCEGIIKDIIINQVIDMVDMIIKYISQVDIIMQEDITIILNIIIIIVMDINYSHKAICISYHIIEEYFKTNYYIMKNINIIINIKGKSINIKDTIKEYIIVSYNIIKTQEDIIRKNNYVIINWDMQNIITNCLFIKFIDDDHYIEFAGLDVVNFKFNHDYSNDVYEIFYGNCAKYQPLELYYINVMINLYESLLYFRYID